MADDGAVVLCREKFTERLPFVIRQDADVAVNNQVVASGKSPSHWSRLSIAWIMLPWKLSRLVVWVAALAVWARPPSARGRRSDDLLERLVLEPYVQLEVPLGDLVIDVSELHQT